MRRGIVPFCGVRVVSAIKRGARNCTRKRCASTLPSRLSAACILPRLRVSSDADGRTWKQAESFAAERIASVLNREGEHARIQEEYAAQVRP